MAGTVMVPAMAVRIVPHNRRRPRMVAIMLSSLLLCAAVVAASIDGVRRADPLLYR
jgi:hypothetical protein